MKRKNMITLIAERAAKIPEPNLRDLTAYAIDEVHAWRCGLIDGENECAAVADVFVEEPDTVVRRYLQPFSEWRAWYFHQPFVRWVQTLQEWDGDYENVRWRWSNKFLKPWKFIPKPKHEFEWMARFAASRTWYSADGFIASYVAHAAERLAGDDAMGIPSFFVTDDMDARLEHGTGIDCYNYSLRTLAQMARDAEDEMELEDFADALAEAIKLGMLWD